MTQPLPDTLTSFFGTAQGSAPAEAAKADDARAALATGKEPVAVIFPDDEQEGGYSRIAPDQLAQALKEGARVASPDEVAAVDKRVYDREQGQRPSSRALAAFHGVGSTLLPFGIFDTVAGEGVAAIDALRGNKTREESKKFYSETLRHAREENPGTALAGELTGMGLSMGLGAGARTAAGAAELSGLAKVGKYAPTELMSGAGRLAEKGAEAAAARVGLGKFGQKAVGLAAQGATEGALWAESAAVDESIIEDKDLTVQHMLGAIPNGALFGGALNLGLGAAGAVAGKAMEKASGLLGGAAARREADAAVLALERKQALEELIAEGNSPEQAELLLKNQDRAYTTGSASGDAGARLKYKSLGGTSKYHKRNHAAFGKDYEVQLGEAAIREGIAGTPEEALEIVERRKQDVIDKLGIRDEIPVGVNIRDLYLGQVRKLRELERMPFADLSNEVAAQRQVVSALEKEFGLLEEAKRVATIGDPKAPKISDEPDFEKLAREMVGPEPKDPTRALEAKFEKDYPRPTFDEARVRAEIEARTHPANVEKAYADRLAAHEESLGAWEKAKNRYLATSNNWAEVAAHEKAANKWLEDMQAATTLLREEHEKKVSDAIADYVKRSDDVLKQNIANAKTFEEKQAAIAARQQAIPFAQVKNFRQRLDQVFAEKGAFNVEKDHLRHMATRKARNAIEETMMDAIAKHAKATNDGKLYETIVTQKQRFRELSALGDLIADSRARYAQNNFFPLGAKLMGAAGSAAGATIGNAVAGPVGAMLGQAAGGAAGAFGTKLLRDKGVPAIAEWLYHNSGAGLSAQERLLQARNVVHAADKRMEYAAKRAIDGSSKGGTKLGAGRGNDTTEQLFRRAEKLIETLQDPAKLQSYVQKHIGLLSQEAPQLTAAFATRAGIAISYLQSQLPKNREPSNPLQPHLVKPRPPNSLELARFARVMHAVDKPMDLLELMARNQLKGEHVAAVKAVYPGIYEEMRTKVLQAVQNTKKPLPYEKRTQLAVMFDAPALDPLSAPQNVSAIQSFFPQYEQQAAGVGVNPAFAVPKAGKPGPGRPAGASHTTLPGKAGSAHSTLPPMQSSLWATESTRREARR